MNLVGSQTQRIQAQVEKIAQCSAEFVESAVVAEGKVGEAKWAGVVQVFRLSNHGSAQYGYGWIAETPGGKQIVVSLEDSRICSARSAVRCWIKTR
jgi:hypothetical protein